MSGADSATPLLPHNHMLVAVSAKYILPFFLFFFLPRPCPDPAKKCHSAPTSSIHLGPYAILSEHLETNNLISTIASPFPHNNPWGHFLHICDNRLLSKAVEVSNLNGGSKKSLKRETAIRALAR